MYFWYNSNKICFYFRHVNITAVEIDPAMLAIATNYFGLAPDETLKVAIDDGIVFLENAAEIGKLQQI